uniref:Uncharacterized protein n=1 Tax=Sphaerodactylus townsendi TaxID=933632 RepID=A0ACB8F6S0_9SAUR
MMGTVVHNIWRAASLTPTVKRKDLKPLLRAPWDQIHSTKHGQPKQSRKVTHSPRVSGEFDAKILLNLEEVTEHLPLDRHPQAKPTVETSESQLANGETDNQNNN